MVRAWPTAAATSAAALAVRGPARAIMPCPGAGTNTLAVERAARLAAAVEPVEPGGGEHEHVHLAGGELAQPRVDVAAQLDHLEVGPHGEQLGAAAQRARPHARALAHVRRAPARRPARRSGSARRGAATIAVPVGQLARHVLGRVHGEVDLAGQQRRLERADPARLVAARAVRRRRRW